MIGIAKYSFYVPAPTGVAKDSGTVLGPIGIYAPVEAPATDFSLDFSQPQNSGYFPVLFSL